MRFSRGLPVMFGLVGVVVAVGGAGCDGGGTFTPDRPDAGPFIPPVELGVGAPCVYNRDGQNPTNDCPTGMECLIFTSDAAFTTNMQLSTWEDHFTVYEEDVDLGYCTFVGSPAQPPQCPSGSTLKLLTQNIAVCVKTCSADADCGRDGYVCDVRYYDLLEGPGQPICVRGCELDVPDCVRSGIVALDANQPPTLGPTLAFEDLAGASQCGATGICESIPPGTPRFAGPGEPCTSSSECEIGSVCYQAPLLAAILTDGASINVAGPGFCASTCTPLPPNAADPDGAGPLAGFPQSNCSIGFVCQAVGNLNLNFDLDLVGSGFPGPLVLNVGNGAIDQRGGMCFQQCEVGVQASCDAIAGTGCGSLDELGVDAQWNNVPQCLPDALRTGG